MAKQENWNYLLNALRKNDDMFKKMRDHFFEIEDGGHPSIETCVKKAYGDVCRTLRGINKKIENESDKEVKEGHEADISSYKSDTYSYIEKQISELLNNKNLEYKDMCKKQEVFDVWHETTCEGIKEKSEKINKFLDNPFSHGHAQKWLNMTLKTMLVAEYDEWKELDKLRCVLHIPVDNYIIDAAHNILGIRYERGKKYGSKYPWSKWKYDIYYSFQKKVRCAVKYRDDYTCPIDWEFNAWMTAIKEKQ